MQINTFFKSVKYINLLFREDRNIHCLDQLKEVGIKADRVDAISLDDKKTACNLSHLKALKESAGHTLIFEDDVWFSDYIKEVEPVLQDLDFYDWDVFYLGANHRKHPLHIKGHLGKAVEPYCCHAYAVNKNSLKKVIDLVESDGRIIDAVLAENVVNGNLNAYCANPGLAFQLPNHSDIEGRYMSYEFMVPNRDREKLERLMGIDLIWS